MTVIPYTIFSWKPPELSASQRIELGRAITAVGRKSFLNALKRRMAEPGKKSFSWGDVLTEAEVKREPPTFRQKFLATAALLGAMAIIFAIGKLPLLLIALAVVGPVTLGSWWWTTRKIDHWVQDVIEEYARSQTTSSVKG